MRKSTPVLLAVHFAQTVSVRPRNSDLLLARMFGAREKAEANARLIAAAWNACVEINPENPIAAAEAMPEIFRLLLAAVVDAQKICGKGRLDPKEWLEKTHAAIDKAMKEA
jgi:hypothetical protein